MKILFLSHYFPPEVNAPATRTYEHCKRWVAQGHEVTVVSCVPHHPMGEAYPGYQNKWWHEEVKDGIRAIKIKTYITANEGFVKRTWNYVFYMIMAIVIAPFIAKPDVVVSTSPQFFNAIAGYCVSRIKRAPWVQEIRDLWPESIVAVGAVQNKGVIRMLEAIERFVYRKADLIIPVTFSFKDHIEANGGAPDKIHVIRNGANLDLYQPRERDSELAERWGLTGKFVLSYVGTHGMAHGLEVILDAAERLRDETDVVFLLVGDGAVREGLVRGVEERGLTNVRMYGQQPKTLMPSIWSITDVSLVLLRKLDLFKTVIPSKIFESMAMSKPIILGVGGEVKGIISEAETGVCITPESVPELTQAVLKLKNDHDYYRHLAANGRPYVEANFDRMALADEYLEHIKLVVSA